MRYLSLLVLLFLASYASAQKNVIDKIIAVVGEEIVLKSDIENQFLHEQSQGLVNSSTSTPYFSATKFSYQNIRKLISSKTISGSS